MAKYMICGLDHHSSRGGVAILVESPNWSGDWESRYLPECQRELVEAFRVDDDMTGTKPPLRYTWDIVSAAGAAFVLFAEPDMTPEQIESAKRWIRNTRDAVSLRVFRVREWHSNKPDRLFIGVYPTGIVYADMEVEELGDYRRLAFLPFKTLDLEWAKRVPCELKKQIQEDAAKIIARKGEKFQVSTCGQTVTLGQ